MTTLEMEPELVMEMGLSAHEIEGEAHLSDTEMETMLAVLDPQQKSRIEEVAARVAMIFNNRLHDLNSIAIGAWIGGSEERAASYDPILMQILRRRILILQHQIGEQKYWTMYEAMADPDWEKEADS